MKFSCRCPLLPLRSCVSAIAGRSRVVRRRLSTATCLSKGEMTAQVKGYGTAGSQVAGPWHHSLGHKHSAALD